MSAPCARHCSLTSGRPRAEGREPGRGENDGIFDDCATGTQGASAVGKRCAGRHDIVDQHDANTAEHVIRYACEAVARREPCRARTAPLCVARSMP